MLGEDGPEAAGAARQVEHQGRFAGQRQRLARNLFVAPVRETAGDAVAVLVQVVLGVLPVVLVGKGKVQG